MLDAVVLLRCAVEAVVDAADRPAEQAEVARRLAGVDELAALVEAHGERQVPLALGDREVGQRAEQVGVGDLVLGILGQAVVTHLPHHGVEVAEHAEVVRHALGVDVEGGVADAVGVEGGGVGVRVLGRRGAGRVRGVDARVVLVGDDQRAGVGVGCQDVGEALALDEPATGLEALEPHLDAVSRCGPFDGAPELAVERVALVAVALAALPLGHGRAARRPTVDRVVHPPEELGAAGGDGHRLRVAVGHGEAVDDEVGHLAIDDRHRIVRVGGRLGGGEGEREVPLELGLDEPLVVGEVEDAAAVAGLPLVSGIDRARGLARRHLRRERQGVVGGVGVLGGLAVGGVQLGRDVGVVARHRRIRVVAGHGLVDGVVGGRCRHLPARAVQQQLGGRVVVDEELEADPVHEAVECGGLGLGPRRRAAVRLAARLRRRALVVVAPAGRVVAVEVDPVAGRDLAVAVVVGQVLAPQALTRLEGPVVAVGVGHRHEPQLGAVDHVGDRLVGAVAVDDVVGEAAHHLGCDPLAGVLGAGEERGRSVSVAHPGGVARDPERDDVLALDGLADHDQLGDVRVVGGDLLELLLEVAGPAVGAEDGVARLRQAGGHLGGGLAVDLLQLEVDALVGQRFGLVAADDDLDVELTASRGCGTEVVGVDARGPQDLELAAVELADVDVVPVVARLLAGACWRSGAAPAPVMPSPLTRTPTVTMAEILRFIPVLPRYCFPASWMTTDA